VQRASSAHGLSDCGGKPKLLARTAEQPLCHCDALRTRVCELHDELRAMRRGSLDVRTAHMAELERQLEALQCENAKQAELLELRQTDIGQLHELVRSQRARLASPLV
jgi:hypothetical protein